MAVEHAEPEVAPAQIAEPKQEPKMLREQVQRSVLVVEDDPIHRELLIEMLSLWGYRAIPVGSAEEAEFAVRKRRPDVALVDVILPGKSGSALISRLREKFPDLVVVGMSALTDATVARRCKQMGADRFISKPLSMDELAQALQDQHTSWH
jgi:CheY-like chemotaxis protein